MSAVGISDALREAIDIDADAIERAMHQCRITDLGLRTDDEVQAAILESLRQAGPGKHAMAALAAQDFFDNADPAVFAVRRRAALWRSCQLHGCEDAYWALAGADPMTLPAPLLEQIGCIDPHCESGGPYELVGLTVVCQRHRAHRAAAQDARARMLPPGGEQAL